MGCDIHAFLQYKHPIEGLKAEELELGRYYKFFGALANIRGYEIAPTPPRYEWPTVLAPELQDDAVQDGYWHTYSYLTLSECELAHEAFKQHSCDSEGYIPFTELIQRMEQLTELGAEPLFIFAFDN